jgi:hypothetical protein
VKSILRVATVLLISLPLLAAERGIMIREAIIYVQPSTQSAKLSNVGRGREATVLEHSPGWIHVTATVKEGGEMGEDRDISGWIEDKGLIVPSTPNGDQIVYGEAIDSENQASIRGGRKGAADDARRLYFRLAEYFPKSPLAGEGLYRAADIQWQLEKEDLSTRRSAHERDPRDRPEITPDMMKDVMKKFPGTKWADLAAFHLLDNKLCGDWQMQSKCPEKEADMYEKYADEHPNSPALSEALYDAAWRWSTLVTIYPLDGQAKKVREAKQRATAIAQKVITKNANPDWVARAQRLLYMVQSNIPTIGNNIE